MLRGRSLIQPPRGRAGGNWRAAHEAALTVSEINEDAAKLARTNIISCALLRKRDKRTDPVVQVLSFPGYWPHWGKYSCVTDRFHPLGRRTVKRCRRQGAGGQQHRTTQHIPSPWQRTALVEINIHVPRTDSTHQGQELLNVVEWKGYLVLGRQFMDSPAK